MSNKPVHTTLASSYLAYFLFSIVGLLADALVGFEVAIPYKNAIAITCFIVGPALIFWAQQVSGQYQAYFSHGPYRIMRNPTHLGLVILVTGYTAISGSVFFLAVTVLGYFISNILFKKYETIITEKYGEEYKQYKSDVPKIL